MTAAQSLKEPKRQASDFLSFLYHNNSLLAMIAFGYLLTRLVLASLSLAVYRRRIRLLRLLFLTYDRALRHLPKLAVLILSFVFFKFILIILLTNTIKTQKVVSCIHFMFIKLAKRRFRIFKGNRYQLFNWFSTEDRKHKQEAGLFGWVNLKSG